MPEGLNKEWEEALKSYGSFLLSRSMSRVGVKNRLYCIREFARLMVKAGVSPGDVEFKHCEAYVRLKGRRLAPSSLSKNVEWLAHFFDYLADLKVVSKNPFKKIRVKAPPSEREALTEEELERLIETARRHNLLHADIIQFLAFTGLRLEEFLSLRDEDVLVQDGKLYIRVRDAKTGEVRYRRLLKPAAKVLKRRRVSELTGYSRRTVQYHVKKYGELAGIGKRVHPHILRHTFATLLYKWTRDPLLVKEMVGHRDLSTTSQYVHADLKELDRKLESLGLA